MTTKTPLYFSIDAGPNLHLIYPESVIQSVHQFINEELKMYCLDSKAIFDHAGQGITIDE